MKNAKHIILGCLCCICLVASFTFAGMSLSEDREIRNSIKTDEDIALRYVTSANGENVHTQSGAPGGFLGFLAKVFGYNNLDGYVEASDAQIDPDGNNHATGEQLGVSGSLSGGNGSQSYDPETGDSVDIEITDSDVTGGDNNNGNQSQGQPEGEPKLSLNVDFESLKAQNNLVCGWIYQPGTNINFPVVQGSDNEAWLWLNLAGEYDMTGTIFVDYRCDTTTNEHLILHGHNMADTKNLLKFSTLNFYREDESYLSQHPYFEYYDAATGEGRIYEIFSVMQLNIKDEQIVRDFYGVPHDAGYLDRLVGASLYDTGVTPDPNGRIMLLSTCISNHPDERCVIAAIARDK